MESIQVAKRELRLNQNKIKLLLSLLIFTLCAFSTSCANSERASKSERPIAETSPTPSSSISSAPTETPSQPTPAEAIKLPPPKPEEVREAVTRVYQDAVAIDTRQSPAYIVGDFNGDNSQDIAVVVRPAKGKLEEINNEYANWILEDPRLIVLPDPNKSVQKLPPNPGPVKVKADDTLLAIIHGYKEAGWRNHEARQTYMLNNAVGTSMAAEPRKDFQSATGVKNTPVRSGDVIKETLAGEQGFLYWTGAKYAWHKKKG